MNNIFLCNFAIFCWCVNFFILQASAQNPSDTKEQKEEEEKTAEKCTKEVKDTVVDKTGTDEVDENQEENNSSLKKKDEKSEVVDEEVTTEDKSRSSNEKDKSETKIGDAAEEERNIADFQKRSSKIMRASLDKVRQAQWKLLNDYSEENGNKVNEVGKEYNDNFYELTNELTEMLQCYPEYSDDTLAYWVRSFLYADPFLFHDTWEECISKTTEIMNIFHDTTFCPYGIESETEKCNLTTLDFYGKAQSYIKEYDEILYYWQTPKDILGKGEMKELYTDIIDLWKYAAEMEEYPDAMSLDLDVNSLDPITGRDDMISLWEEIKDLYAELLYYMNSHMAKIHKDSFSIDEYGLAPMEFYGTHPSYFGFMPNKTNPYYKNKNRIKIEEVIIEKEITATHFAHYADELLVSMGLEAMSDDFWENSYFEYSEGKSCSNEFVYRLEKEKIYVGMCPNNDIDNLEMIYHNIAAVEQFILMDIAEVTNTFNRVDFAGWQHRISDSVSAILLSPSYLAQLGLVPEDADEETFLYYLFQEYTLVLPKMAYAMATQLWIWQVYNGETTKDTYNCDLYKLMAEYEGMRPPQPRPTDWFDAATRENVIQSSSYTGKVFGYIIKYQIFQSLCKAAGQEGPLYKCNFYDSKEAGELLKSLMSPGLSVPFKDLFKEILGTSFNVEGILEYFSPVIDAIKVYNDENVDRQPWTVDGAESVLCKSCSGE